MVLTTAVAFLPVAAFAQAISKGGEAADGHGRSSS
jgi:hypothetical protein